MGKGRPAPLPQRKVLAALRRPRALRRRSRTCLRREEEVTPEARVRAEAPTSASPGPLRPLVSAAGSGRGQRRARHAAASPEP